MVKEPTKKRSAKGTTKVPGEKSENSASKGVRKQYLKSGACKVTFKLPKDAAPDAATVTLVGDFNGWEKEATPMKKQKNGDFSVALELEKDRKYKYKYLVDGHVWENDWNADGYEKNMYGTEDSVVAV